MHVSQVTMTSLFVCWDILMHDAQHGDIACTDQSEAEGRDVVHHEWCQFLSDTSWTSVDEVLSVRSAFSARLQVYQGLETFHCSTKKSFLSSCPSCPCLETLQDCDQWMAEPSRQQCQCQQQENSLCHSCHETDAHVLLDTCDLLMHTLEMHRRLPGCPQKRFKNFWVICRRTRCVMLILPIRHRRQCSTQHHPHSKPSSSSPYSSIC